MSSLFFLFLSLLLTVSPLSFQSCTSSQFIERSVSWCQARREPADAMRRWDAFSQFFFDRFSHPDFASLFTLLRSVCAGKQVLQLERVTVCTESGIEMDTEMCDEERRVKSKQSCSELFFFMSPCRHSRHHHRLLRQCKYFFFCFCSRYFFVCFLLSLRF